MCLTTLPLIRGREPKRKRFYKLFSSLPLIRVLFVYIIPSGHKESWLAIVYELYRSIHTIIRQTILTHFAVVVRIKGSICSCMHTLQLIAFFELIAYNLSDILPRSSINSDWIQECDIASDRQFPRSLLVFFVFSISVLFCVIFFHLVSAILTVRSPSRSRPFCSSELISELKLSAYGAYSSILSDFSLYFSFP
nr:MAG TPA: hypothetical protein [Caudoviricetes sp.]